MDQYLNFLIAILLNIENEKKNAPRSRMKIIPMSLKIFTFYPTVDVMSV